MTEYIATFHTHLSAMRTQRALAAEGVNARISPVPRYLSEPHLGCMDADVERVVEHAPPGQDCIELLYRA